MTLRAIPKHLKCSDLKKRKGLKIEASMIDPTRLSNKLRE